MNQITIAALLAAYAKKGYKLYDDGSINIIGVRCTNEITDKWDDYLCDLWKENGEWKLEVMQATTKPGAYPFATGKFASYRGVIGAALVKEGQYHGVWTYMAKGHFGHDALKQKGSFDLYRIKERKYDLSKAVLQTNCGPECGIEQHSVWNTENTAEKLEYVYPSVWNWAIGCQVIAKQTEMEEHGGRIQNNIIAYGNSFSYTLFNIADLENEIG